MKAWLRRLPWAVLGLAVAAAVVAALWPRPAEVELAEVARGPLLVTVDEDGKTRVRERYTVTAPVAGRMQRVALHAGDPVEAGKTLLAAIDPGEPDLLDDRARRLAEKKRDAADTARKREGSELRAKQIAVEMAEADCARTQQQRATLSVPAEQLEKCQFKLRAAQEELRTAQHKVQITEFEYEQAEAALLRTKPRSPGDEGEWRVDVRSPITGRVLKVHKQSATSVTPGLELVDVGDPTDLEIEVDLLSTDAVKVRPGARMIVKNWGGPHPLEARVRVVEPGGFMKTSALGVEEQRVWVIADFVDPLERRATLGDAYRVEASVVVWPGEDVLKVPSGAVFRHGQGSAAFVAREGKAVLREVRAGHTNGRETEILDGLEAGDRVIVHPGDKIKDGVSVTPRPGS